MESPQYPATGLSPNRTSTITSALPPIPSISLPSKHTQQPTLFENSGKMIAKMNADMGSMASLGTILESAPEITQDPATISVCQDCQRILLDAFEHCLQRNGQCVPLDSTYLIDEEADGKIQTNAPLFDIVNDPTEGQVIPSFDDPIRQIERDRWVLSQSKKTAGMINDTPMKPKTKGLGIKPGKSFSGALYKRMLDSKDREITELRKRLYEATQREAAETDSVKKLKKALNRSVKYYTFAEEWQQGESARLQNDIKHLKGEISSLMAILINSEVHKQHLIAQIQDLNIGMKQKQEIADQAVGEFDGLKAKLQDAYKEYISMNETMVQLRKEAVKGNEAVESRNVMLQKSLAKLTTDFEVSAKDLRAANSKIRELEYELDQMVVELNEKGESLTKSTQAGHKLKNILDKTSRELTDLQSEHEQLILLKSKIEADARADSAEKEQQKVELRKRLELMTQDFNSESRKNHDLEQDIIQNKQEFVILREQIKTLTVTGNSLTKSLAEMKERTDKEIAKRDAEISTLTVQNVNDARKVAMLEEKREQLLFQVTELRNAYENESSQLRNLTSESELYKKDTERKLCSLTEQVDKLTQTQQSLQKDKKELTEKIKIIRNDLREKEEILEDLNKELEETQTNYANDVASFERKLALLNTEHKRLQQQHESLNTTYIEAVKDGVTLKREKDQKEKNLGDTQRELHDVREIISSLLIEKDVNSKETLQLRLEHDDIKAAYTQLQKDQEELRNAYQIYRAASENTILELHGEIFKHQTEIEENISTIKLLQNDKANLEFSVEDLQQKMAETIKKLQEEAKTRNILETKLYENRKEFEYEKRIRLELERVQNMLKIGDAGRAFGQEYAWETREKRFEIAYEELESESLRLTKIVAQLPKDGIFGDESDFIWPTDVPGLPKKPPKKKAGSEL